MMGLTTDQQRIKTLLTETITLLCKNGLHFKSEFCIEGLLGITLDKEHVFLININETVRADTGVAKSQTASKAAGTACVVSDVHSHKIDGSSRQHVVQHHCPADKMAKSWHLSEVDCSERLPSVSTSISMPQESETDRENQQVGRKRPHSVSRSSSCSDFSLEHDHSIQDQEYSDYSSVMSDSTNNRSQQTEIPRQSLVPIYKRTAVTHQQITELDANKTTDGTSINFNDGSFDVVNVKQESGDSTESESVSSQQSMPIQSYQHSHRRSSLPSCSTETDYAQFHSSVTQQSNSGWGNARLPAASYNMHKNESNACAVKQATGMSLKSSVVYSCPECGKTMTTALGLSQHIKSIHCSIYSFLCPVCNKGFNSARDMRGHMACKHNMQKEYRCVKCGREFGYKRSLREHSCIPQPTM